MPPIGVIVIVAYADGRSPNEEMVVVASSFLGSELPEPQ